MINELPKIGQLYSNEYGRLYRVRSIENGVVNLSDEDIACSLDHFYKRFQKDNSQQNEKTGYEETNTITQYCTLTDFVNCFEQMRKDIQELKNKLK